jgi:hypothetical protein
MANGTQSSKKAHAASDVAPEQLAPSTLSGTWMQGQAVKGACAGAARALVDWLIRTFTGH